MPDGNSDRSCLGIMLRSLGNRLVGRTAVVGIEATAPFIVVDGSARPAAPPRYLWDTELSGRARPGPRPDRAHVVASTVIDAPLPKPADGWYSVTREAVVVLNCAIDPPFGCGGGRAVDRRRASCSVSGRRRSPAAVRPRSS